VLAGACVSTSLPSVRAVVLSYARSLRSPRAARSLEESVGVQLAAQATTGAKCDLVDRIGVQTQLQPQVRRCLVTHQQREEDRALKALAGFADDEQQCVGGCLAGDIVEVGAAEVPDTAGQRLLTHTAEPGSSAAAALALLA